MSPSKRFQPVQRIAVSREQKAARALGESRKALQEQERRLEELRTYHREYLERFQGASASGISAAQLHEYRAFLAKLEQAIREQERQLEQSRQQCSGRKAEWQETHQRTQALGKVMERFHSEERRLQESRDQKELDDRNQRGGPKR